MNLNIFGCLLLVCCACHSCNSQKKEKVNSDAKNMHTEIATFEIDSLYSALSGNKSLKYEEIQGQFVYQDRKVQSSEYLAIFISRSTHQPIKYAGYDGDKNDGLYIGDKRIDLRSKIEPSSIKIYRLFFERGQYLAFIGKGQSASGSGVQVSYFNLIKMDEKQNIESHFEFESRFGDIHSIGDFNNDGALDYLKIVNGKKMNDYQLTIKNIKTDNQTMTGYILLKYKFNDRFELVQDSLLRK